MVKGKTCNPYQFWSKEAFAEHNRGKRIKLLAAFGYFGKCIKWSIQRIRRGFCDPDIWDMCGYLQVLLPDMLQYMKDTRMGSPSCLGKNYVNEDGKVVNDTCHEEWDQILDRMIFLWHESWERTCSKKNEFEEEYMQAFEDYLEKYESHVGSKHPLYLSDIDEYKEIYEKHSVRDKELEKYRSDCKDEALDMLKEYFYYLWD